jgi:D-alanyl-lipoteichoic acid acyltransferase DltB (MBOAT superfamily)
VVFNSLTFLLFFGVVLGLYHLPMRWTAKKCLLIAASYLFYGAWNPPFVLLLLWSTVLDWFVAKWLYRVERRGARRAVLTLSLIVNLGLLGFFKYGSFLLEQFVALTRAFGIDYQPAAPDIVLPVGISFYTFQTLTYTIDVYRKRMKPWGSFLDFALYVTFFPQLVAGPIVRATEFLPQCVEPRRATMSQFSWGVTLLCLGLVEKVILADGILTPVADAVYASPGEAGVLSGWLGAMAFSGQIFFDFAGYSNCAIGAALCMGFILPENFRFPYAALGFADYWRRWHISLSTWLRDYLYVSLGGGAKGPRRGEWNLALTMLLGGLWHGAAWTFVVWGGLHGICLVIERWIQLWWGRRRLPGGDASRFAIAIGTWLMMCFGFVFFRSPDFGSAFTLLTAMLGGGPGTLSLAAQDVALASGVTGGMLGTHWLMRDTTVEAVAKQVPWWGRSCALSLLLIALVLAPGDNRAFIYFQF